MVCKFVNWEENDMKTAIMTDTNSGLSIEEGKQHGIFVLPMPVIIDEKCYLEGIDITNAKLYDALLSGRDVSSSQPSPGDVMNLWDEILGKGYDEIVYIPMSSGLSGSCANAVMLAKEYGSKVWVADNHRISATLLQAVFDAKSYSDKGMSAKEIKEALEASAYDASIYISVDSLKYLIKSGRVTSSAAAIGNILNIKPVLTIQGEKLDLCAKVRGMKQCERKMIESLKSDIATRFSDIPSDRLQIATAGTFDKPENAEKWRSMVQDAFPESSVYYVPLSCSIACHVGVNAVGTAISVIANR